MFDQRALRLEGPFQALAIVEGNGKLQLVPWFMNFNLSLMLVIN